MVNRRTAIREFSSSIWNNKKRGGVKDELRHAVRSFLRICLIAKASLHRACQICQGLYTGLLAYNENHASNLEYHSQAKHQTGFERRFVAGCRHAPITGWLLQHLPNV